MQKKQSLQEQGLSGLGKWGIGSLGAELDPDRGVLEALEGAWWESHNRSAYKEGREMAGLCVTEGWNRRKVRGRKAEAVVHSGGR